MSQAVTKNLWEHLNHIREQKPLVHNITNSVVTNLTANALLATGASPLMAHEPEELEEIVSISNSLVINIGTLDINQIASMKKAVNFANNKKIPIVIDPVGAGASELRTSTSIDLIKSSNNCIVRGNGSEVMSLVSTLPLPSQGVDSSVDSNRAVDAGQNLIQNNNNIKAIIISGKTDFVVSKNKVSSHHNGHSIMSKVTGMGCTLTALTGAFVSNTNDIFSAAQNAVDFMGLCGELAKNKSAGPGSFVMHFLDQLHNLTEDQINNNLRVNLC